MTRLRTSRAWILALGGVTMSAWGCRSQPTDEALLGASLIQLIATPERFDGEIVRTVGYCRLETDVEALYVRKEDRADALTLNSLRLPHGIRKEFDDFQEGYVVVEGLFEGPKENSIYSGSLTDISRFEPWLNREQMTHPPPQVE